ncbi:MAG TPA: phosphate ABC transporter substrate-binding protein PstS [Thermomicrobiales bacterium]|nr:phosphate ABC transporter substrate-binding protein PstS [Thermomicrobiales bacterium]
MNATRRTDPRPGPRAPRHAGLWWALVLAVLLTACGGSATATLAPTAPVSSGGAASTATSAPAAITAAASPLAAGTPAGSPAAGATPDTSIKITGSYSGEAASLNANGATFPQPLYSKWFDEYAKLTGVKVNYQGNGSGAGKKAIADQTADFAGSDSFMTDQELAAAQAKCGAPVLNFPTTLGAIVVTYNVQGLEQKKLKLDGPTIAGIFLGDITKWNDPALTALNPGVPLPNQDIVVVHRSDGSGTTDNFTSYLSAVSDKWKGAVGSGTSVNWKVGLGASGNQGVAGELKNNPYSIGYVEQNYADQQKLPYADVKNKAGVFVTPSLAGVTAAAQAAAPSAPADFRFKIVDADGATSYPISVLTYLLVCPKQTNQAKAIAITRLMWWMIHEGQQYSAALDYAPLPPEFVVREEQVIRTITVNGQPAFPGK